MDHFTKRMLRLDGNKPTARDRWRAFYRIYRLVKRSEDSHNLMGGAKNALIVLDRRFGRWIAIMESNDRTDSSSWPTFLRKIMLESERRRRIYANGDYDKLIAMDKQCAVRLRNKEGIEMTPEEVGSHRARLCSIMRAKAAEMDLRVPDDDTDLIQWFNSIKD
jgi:hypothetical protein